MKKKIIEILKKHLITILGFLILGSVLLVAFCNFWHVNSKINNIYNQAKNRLISLDKLIICQIELNKDIAIFTNAVQDSLYCTSKDSLDKSSNVLSMQINNNDITLSTQKLINLYQHIFKDHITEMELLKNKLFDNNTVTFLVSFVLVFLGGILFNIEARSNTQLEKTKSQIKDAVDKLKEMDEKTIQADNLLKDTNNQLDQAKKQSSNAEEQFKNINMKNTEIEKKIVETQEQIDITKGQLNTSKDLLKKYQHVFSDLYPRILMIRILSINIKNILFSQEYCITESISSLVFITESSTNEIIDNIHANRYKLITKENKDDLDDILEKTIYQFEIEKINSKKENIDKTKPIQSLLNQLESLQKCIQNMKVIK